MKDRASTNVGRFHEAVAWFRNRVPMLKGAWEDLSGRAQRRAVTVAGVAELDLVADVFRAIEKALADGTDLRKFREQLGEKLAREWGHTDPTRLETIFRNNVQASYNAGRWKQMQEPALLKARPFARLLVLMDTRTSTICQDYGRREVVLPLDHPWWTNHWPPFHHRCRTTVVSMTTRQAERLGVTQAPPKAEPDEGFGLIPGKDEWKPDLKDYPKQLVQVFRRRYKE